MKVNERRKQMYLNGEVGIVWNPENETVDYLLQLESNVNGDIFWKGRTTPEVFHPLSWFFEQDEPQTEPELIVGKKYKVVGNTSDHGFNIGEEVICKDAKRGEFVNGKDWWMLYSSDVIPFTEPRAPTAWRLNIDVPEWGDKGGDVIKNQSIPESILAHIATPIYTTPFTLESGQEVELSETDIVNIKLLP